MRNVEDIYPLAPTQQGMLFHTLYNPKSGMYVERLSWTLRGSLNLHAFEQAWQRVLDRHQILRSSFFVEGLDEPLHVVRQHVKVPLELYDWRQLSAAEQEELLKYFLQVDQRRGFELAKAPLMRISAIKLTEKDYKIIWRHHHMLLDGWSVSFVLKEVFLLYAAFVDGNDLNLGQAAPYSDYIAWTRRQDQSEAEEFWRSLLKGFTAPTPIPGICGVDGPVNEDGPASEEVLVSAEVTAAIQSISRQQQLTLNTIAQGAWALLLSNYSGEQDIVFGSVVSGRPTELPYVESMVGLFLNTLPVRASVAPELPLMEWLRKIQAQQVQARKFEYSSLAVTQSRSEIPSGRQLFESTLAFENFPVDINLLEHRGEIEILEYVRYGSRTNYPINVVVAPGKQLMLQIGYDRRRSEAASIKRMLCHFRTILESIANNPYGRVSDPSLLTEAEKRQLLFEWNETSADTSSLESVTLLFERQVRRAPNAIAVEIEGKSLTYGHLNARANQLARHLRLMGVGPEVLVGVCVEPSPEMAIGVLGVLKAGGAYLPIDPSYPSERLNFMLDEARVGILLTQEHLIDAMPSYWIQAICLDSDWDMIAIQDTDDPLSNTSGDNLAYVIYTSGSTGRPKGVMVEHKGLCNLAEAQIRAFQVKSDSRVLQFASLSFDASVSEIFTTLLAGATLHLIKREALFSGLFSLSVLRLNQVTIVTLPPSTLSGIGESGAELPALETIIAAGEACPVELIARWGQGRRFLNAYGPTEATVCATIVECSDPTRPPTIGSPISNVQVYILNAHLQCVPVSVPAELYISGLGLARGYLNRPGLTAERFIPNPFGSQPDLRLYKTGDLTSYLPTGEIQFYGRRDNQVKVRGYRIELGEIEATLASCPGVRESAVIGVEKDPGSKGLIAYFVPDQESELDVHEVRRFLQERLPNYMIPEALKALMALPLTPNGKVDYLALQSLNDPSSTLKETFVAPRDAVEEVFVGIWAQALNVERVGVEDDFFSLGGDSIRGLQVLSKAQECGWNFTLSQLFELRTIRAIANQIRGEKDPVPPPVTRQFDLISHENRLKLDEDIEDAYPLSKLQSGMIFHVETRPNTAIYRSLMSLHLRANLDIDVLRKAAEQLVHRHPSLRTSFDIYKFGEPIQLVHRKVDVPFEVEDISHLSSHEQEEFLAVWFETEKLKRFDWMRPPLLQFSIHQRGAQSFQFGFAASHAIMDGWSDGVFLAELAKCYAQLQNGGSLQSDSEPLLTFRDYIAVERSAVESSECRRYWDQKLINSSIARLPRRPFSQVGESKQTGDIDLTISAELSKKIIKLAQNNAVPLKSILLAAHFKVLSLLTGQSDIITGLVTSVRPEKQDSDRVIGLFLNTIPFRMVIRESSWVDLIKEIFEAEIEFLPYRFYPMAQIQQDRGDPLFETCFNFTHFHNIKSSSALDGIEVLSIDNVTETDFALLVHFSLDAHSSALHLSVTYDTRELCEEQATAATNYYLQTLEAITNAPFEQHQHYSPLSAQERRQIIEEWNQTWRVYPRQQCLHGLFEEQATLTPEAVTVIHEEQVLSYKELNYRANQLARYLQDREVGPETLVGICMERSVDMVVGMLGVLKAGAGYVPMDASLPKQRLLYILKDSGARFLLTQERLREVWSECTDEVLCLDREWGEIKKWSGEKVESRAVAENVAYLIYTSGSTGEPKGVLGLHRGVVNRCHWMWEAYPFEEGEVCCQKTSLSFVDSVCEIFGPLLRGAPIVIIPDLVVKDIWELAETLKEEEVTRLVLVPSLLNALLEHFRSHPIRCSVKLWISSGEKLSPEMARRFAEIIPWGRLVNLYGSSEVSADVSCCEMNESVAGHEGSLIGRPIDNTYLYALGGYLQPSPVGAIGELYVGGEGLARGYLNRPVLTAGQFIPHPFSLEPGERLYRSGDLVRYLMDGNIEYLGRIDHQVKIRGYRIELGEIEATLMQHPAVSNAVVAAKEDVGREKYLVAYVVSPDQVAVDQAELRGFLKDRLPEYMTPSIYVQLESFPLLPNGKINRRALPEPIGRRQDINQTFIAPRTPVEEVVAGIWAEGLGLEKVGVTDNFFDLGGHSLLGIWVISQVHASLQVELRLGELFENPTVSGMAQCVEERFYNGS